MNRSSSLSFKVFLTSNTEKFFIEVVRDIRVQISVYVAKLPTKMNIDTIIFAGIIGLGINLNTMSDSVLC